MKIFNRFYNLKIGKDFMWNIMASVVATGVLQIVVYPILASNYDKNFYGVILTSMGLINTMALSFGNSLNNTKLITLDIYDNEKSDGDFNVLLLYSNIIVSISVLFLGLFLFKFDFLTILGTLILSSLLILRSYFVVHFRIKLNFRAFFFNSLILAIGYAIGSLLNLVIEFWPMPFIIGEVFSLIHLLVFWKPRKVAINRSSNFRLTMSKSTILILTSVIGNALIYMDRILLFPLLGSESVSIYTVASFFGKTLSIISAPIAGVLLSYYSTKGYLMTRKKFINSNILIFISSIGFIPFIFIFAPFMTRMLYPSIFDDAEKYIILANLGALLIVVTRMMQPAIIKFAPTYWLLLKEGMYGILYIVLSIILIPIYGINGLIGVTIISAILKILIMFIIGLYYIPNNKKIENMEIVL